MFSSFLYIPELFGVSIEVYFILLILGIPIFLFWRWLYRKRIDNLSRRRIMIWLSTILTTPIIYILTVMVFLWSWFFHPQKLFHPQEPFNRERWLQYNEVDGRDRDGMIQDLFKTHKLVGLSHQQIIQLLGQPANFTDTTKPYYQLTVDYDTIDPIYEKDLVIKFNKDSIVTEAKIHEWHKGDQ